MGAGSLLFELHKRATADGNELAVYPAKASFRTDLELYALPAVDKQRSHDASAPLFRSQK